MSDIQNLIELLKSNNPDIRYNACEELRVLVLREALPQEAIDALNFVTNDSNPDAADAAQRALAFHAKVIDEQEQEKDNDQIDGSRLDTGRLHIFIGLLVGLGTAFIMALVARESILGFVGSFLRCSLGIPFPLIGAYIGKNISKKSGVSGSEGLMFIGSFVGAGFEIVLFFIFFPYQ